MGFGLPDMAQIIYKLSVTPSSAKSSGSSGNAVSNPKGPTTHYTLDFAVSLNQIKLDVQPVWESSCSTRSKGRRLR